MTAVVLVADDLDIERRLCLGMGPERFGALVTVAASHVATDPVFAAQRLAESDHEVVVLGPRLDPMSALAVAEMLDRARPDVTTIIVAERSPELLELALTAGVRAVLPPDVDPFRLADAVDRAIEVSNRRRPPVLDLRDHGPFVDAEPEPTGRIITVVAPKGGSGKTTVSTNLSVGLARFVRDGVALVDLDLQFGDVADALGLDPAHSIGDIRGRAAHLDSAELKMLLTHHASGVHALCAPPDPAAGEEVTPDDVRAALSVLAKDLPYVVVDTAAGIDEATLTAVEMSSDLVLLASNDVASIRNLRKLLTALDRIGAVEATRHLVLNRAGSKVGISPADIEATLGMPIAVSVPSSRTITISFNQGEPLMVAEPHGALAQPFNDLVGRFAEVPTARASGFARLRRIGR